MLETYFSAAKMLGHLRSGPSGPYLDGFAAALEQQGYGPETAVRYLRAAAHIGHVMAEQGAGLTDVDLAAFGEHLRTCRCPRAKGGRRNHHTIYGARLFRRHLVELGLCRSAAVGAAPAEPQLLVADFKTWLRKHRGASDATVRLYSRDAAGLMMELRSDPAGWRPNDVRSYFLERASNSGSGTIEKITTSLRAFLRYLAVAGRCQAGLDGAVPAYAHWQLADMPRYLSTEQVDRLIAACDGDAGARRRDRAIVLLLVRLGLRAGDVAQLRLSDIEWQTGSLRVCGKSRYEVRLPLPQDVGDAIGSAGDSRIGAAFSARSVFDSDSREPRSASAAARRERKNIHGETRLLAELELGRSLVSHPRRNAGKRAVRWCTTTNAAPPRSSRRLTRTVSPKRG